jgi:hypothetical protein
MAEPKASPEPGYERRDARLAPVLGFLAVLSVATTLVVFGSRWMFESLERAALRRDRPAHVLQDDREPPAPRLQDRPGLERREFLADQERATGEYGWVDRDAGVVRLPVERAIELLAERGLPHEEGR